MIFDTLEYLLKGGRIGKVQAMLGGLLKVNPIITLKDGLTMPVARARNRAKAKDMLVDLVKEIPNIEEMFVEDATTTEEREELEGRISAFFPQGENARYQSQPGHRGPLWPQRAGRLHHFLQITLAAHGFESNYIPVVSLRDLVRGRVGV